MASKQQAYELESFLQDIADRGYGIIYISKLWRLLEKGSRAPGTWKALLDVWEELGDDYDRSELHMCEVRGEYLIITTSPTKSMQKWAQES